MDISAIRDLASDDMQAVNDLILRRLESDVVLINQIGHYIVNSGGKRLRPLLVLLAARASGYAENRHVDIAAVIEFIHTATLLHDDVVDGASLRRGKMVANRRWDTPTTVLTGDFLLARGLTIASETGLCEVIETIAGITENMSQGEIRQLEKKGDIHLSESDYLEVIRCKTAVLFQGACRTGALVAGVAQDKVQRLTDYGYHLGLAFQMADDLLDYTQDTSSLGKHAGADLREGKLTLPLIHALSLAGKKDQERMKTLIQNPDFTLDEFDHLVEMLHSYGGIAYTESKATLHLEKAKAALEPFDDHKTREILEDIADYALVRKV